MAYEQSCRAVTAIAGVDLSSLQYQFAVFDTDGEVNSGGTNLTAQGRVDGIVGEAVEAGKSFPLVLADGGKTMVKLGATVTAGQVVATAADGRAIARCTSNGDLGWGVFLEGGDANEIVPIQFAFKGQVNA
jgi:hypothetical protein